MAYNNALSGAAGWYDGTNWNLFWNSPFKDSLAYQWAVYPSDSSGNVTGGLLATPGTVTVTQAGTAHLTSAAAGTVGAGNYVIQVWQSGNQAATTTKTGVMSPPTVAASPVLTSTQLRNLLQARRVPLSVAQLQTLLPYVPDAQLASALSTLIGAGSVLRYVAPGKLAPTNVDNLVKASSAYAWAYKYTPGSQ